MERLGKLLLWIFTGLVLIFLVTPMFIVFILSFSADKFLHFPPSGLSLQWYDQFFASQAWVQAALTSLYVGICVTVLSLALGIPAAVALVRGRFIGRRVMAGIILSPVIVPGIIVAIGLYYAYAAYKLVGNPVALIIGHSCLAVPFVVIAVANSLSAVDPRLEQAARNLGAGPFSTFRQVTLPLIRNGVFSGSIFAFATSFDELLVSLFLSGSGAVTLPRRIWDQLRYQIEPTIAAASSLLIVLTAVLMIAAEVLRRRAENARGRG